MNRFVHRKLQTLLQRHPPSVASGPVPCYPLLGRGEGCEHHVSSHSGKFGLVSFFIQHCKSLVPCFIPLVKRHSAHLHDLPHGVKVIEFIDINIPGNHQRSIEAFSPGIQIRDFVVRQEREVLATPYHFIHMHAQGSIAFPRLPFVGP